MAPDPFDLQRFVDAQAPVFRRVLNELRRGYKESHWMWFVFPQLRGLGRSEAARYYGIGSLEEARAYWTHSVLGPRLADCTALVLAVEGRTAREIFGQPDDLKFRSCMTLFERAAPSEPGFARAIELFFDGVRDERTLAQLGTA